MSILRQLIRRAMSVQLMGALAIALCASTVGRAQIRPASSSLGGGAETVCEVTKALWVTPPQPAGADPLPTGYWYVNEDRTIWVPMQPWYAGKGNKLIWIRPQGTDLKVSGRRLDGPAPALKISIPCCYPTDFQMTGATFPVAGCWEVSATAGASSLVVVLDVLPAEQH